MNDKFSFQDVVGCVLPGGLLFLLTYWFLFSFIGLFQNFSISNASVFETVIAILLFYFFGHIPHTIGTKIERKLIKKWNGWHSVQFLKTDNSNFSLEFKTKLIKELQDTFGIDIINETIDTDKKRYEIFELARTYCFQYGFEKNNEKFNSIYVFYRSLAGLFTISVVISALIFFKSIVMTIIEYKESNLITANKTNLVISFALLVLSFLFIKTIEIRMTMFSIVYVSTVYRNFYTLKIREKSTAYNKRTI